MTVRMGERGRQSEREGGGGRGRGGGIVGREREEGIF